ncbi:MAG: OmpA family protein [Myxococcota bacterium]
MSLAKSIAKFGAVAVLVFAVGCKKKAPEAPAPEPEPAPAQEKESNYGPVIDPVLFETGGVVIDADQLPAVDAAADIVRNSDWKVLVVGLADATGDAETNKRISQERADNVAGALRERLGGIPADRIVSIGIGERLATGESQSERKAEFVFFHDKGLPYKQVVIKSGVLEEDFRARRAARH